MHFFDLIDACRRQRPFVPFRITTSAGTVLSVADPSLLTLDKADSIIRVMLRNAEGHWMDVAIRGSQVASFEVPSTLFGDDGSHTLQGAKP
jgi:predicted secreted protein